MAKPLTQNVRAKRRSVHDASKECSDHFDNASQRIGKVGIYLDQVLESSWTFLSVRAFIELVAQDIKRWFRFGLALVRGTETEQSLFLPKDDFAGRAIQKADGELKRVNGEFIRLSDALGNLDMSASQLEKDFRLIGSILSAKVQPKAELELAFRNFNALLDDYLKESHDDNFPAEAEAYEKLNFIKSKMSRIRLAPQVAKKNIVAVAGGFSSGKSSFINSLIGIQPGVLPTRVTPTTAIPTYVHYGPGKCLEIAIFNDCGGRVLIDESTLDAISHDFERKYDISLRNVVGRVLVATPHLKGLERVVFVDTPGYSNPESAEIGECSTDEGIALSEILSAQFLVWIVDCERGTLPDSDLSYIKQFLATTDNGNLRVQTVYIVLNKGDKKPLDQLEMILSNVSSFVKANGVHCAGVGVYSAKEEQWYGHWGRPFEEFLEEINEVELGHTLRQDMMNVLAKYVEYHQLQMESLGNRLGLFKRLGILVDDRRNQSRKINKDLEQALSFTEAELRRHEEHAAAYCALRVRFAQCMDQFAKALEEA